MKKGLHFSPELEAATIGACLLEKSAIGRVYGVLESKHFYFEDNQKVFGSMLRMYDQNIPIDIITVECFMMQQGIELVNSNQYGNYAYYIASLTNMVVSAAHLEYHSHVLREMWKVRELEKLTHSGIEPTADLRDQINQLNNQLNEIRGSEFKREWYDMSELMVSLIKHQEDLRLGNKKFLSTGFKSIDRLNGGFYDGQFIVIGARPSVGKSALMGQMAVSMARKGKKVGIISLEMNNTEIAARLASIDTDINFQTIHRNLFEDQQQHEDFYTAISKTTINLPIYVSEKTVVNINEIKAKASKLATSYGCDCLMVDYLQLVDTSGGNKNSTREQEVSKISRGLKLLATDLKIPVIALCQLSREVTKRSAKERYPRLSDLRESGSLEQDADAVLMLHRDWESGYEKNEDGSSTEFEADLFGQKWRNGAKFHLQMEWEPTRMRFKEKPKLSGYTPVADIFDPTESKKINFD